MSTSLAPCAFEDGLSDGGRLVVGRGFPGASHLRPAVGAAACAKARSSWADGATPGAGAAVLGAAGAAAIAVA
eukprot:CAMPEP_0183511888 /NCGR_PEP_ID=MMETSP0371-20130417/11197_1 /TAXON_ID=268820 /ORGANISM="Peridinium aciculiferum, Strain PAER-2" /LENGTH=72 /DNA_ID=CAMNT_0025708871 /DNA_START=163 /DNA_END=378 /DNA_ORIENTATION=-